MKVNWQGATPAITTPFKEDLSIEHKFFGEHTNWMIDKGPANRSHLKAAV